MGFLYATACVLVMMSLANASIAQAKTTPGTTSSKSATDTTKHQLFTVKFGPYKLGMVVLAEDLKRLVNAELKVTDSLGVVWQPVTFRLGWRKRDYSDDIKTGKRKVGYFFNATEVLNSSKIPASWQQEMSEMLQPGEEVMFEEIIVQHPKTKKMMQAPTLQFKLK